MSYDVKFIKNLTLTYFFDKCLLQTLQSLVTFIGLYEEYVFKRTIVINEIVLPRSLRMF